MEGADVDTEDEVAAPVDVGVVTVEAAALLLPVVTGALLPAEEDAVDEQPANARAPTVNAATNTPVRPERDNTIRTPDD